MDESEKSAIDEVKRQSHYEINNSLNLLQRILRQNRRTQSSDSDTFVTKRDDSKSEVKERLNEGVASKSTEDILDSLMNLEIFALDRLKMLNYLIEERSTDRAVVCDRLINFLGELCRVYCSPKCSKNPKYENQKMLLPILQALRKIDGVNGVLSHNSYFVYDLMRACSTCVTTYLSKSKELSRITLKKKLAGRVKTTERRIFFKELSRALGIPDTTEAFESESLNGIFSNENLLLCLFDTTAVDVEKDINKHIAEMNLPEFPDLDDTSEASNAISGEVNPISIKKEEWTDVEIARVLPFGEILAFTRKDWRQWLNLIDGELIQHMKYKEKYSDKPSEIKIGTPVGFWTADARFLGRRPPVETRCLRGITLARAPFDLIEGENVSWVVWAVDIGMLTLCSKLEQLTEVLESYKPLVSLCSLDLKIKDPGKKEGEFLVAAIPLLSELLASKPSAAKHIIAHDAGNFYTEDDRIYSMDLLCVGGAFLMLNEHPDSAVRLEFLKLILSLARNSTEVLRYLVDFKFYLAVSTRLEICAHFCEATTVDSAFWLELRLLLQVLTAILYECEKHTNELPGMSYMQKVLIMLTSIEMTNTYRVKFMAAKCHAILVNFKCDQPSHKDSNLEKTARRKASENVGRVNDDRSGASKHIPNQQNYSKPKQKHDYKAPLEDGMKGVNPEPVLSVMDLKDSDDDDDISSDRPSVNAVFDAKVKVDFYVKGSRINISNSDTVELALEKSALQISDEQLAKLVCSFLNNGIGGTVYYGIDANGIVEGITLDRERRDSFRKGVDRMMAKSIYPEVRPSCYDINYIPVIRSGLKIMTLSAHRTWVIEIQVKALPHLVYTMASNRKCYVREGTKCVVGVALTMRQDAAEHTKKEIEKAVQEFKAQIPDTKDKLVMFVRDYLRKTHLSE